MWVPCELVPRVSPGEYLRGGTHTDSCISLLQSCTRRYTLLWRWGARPPTACALRGPANSELIDLIKLLKWRVCAPPAFRWRWDGPSLCSCVALKETTTTSYTTTTNTITSIITTTTTTTAITSIVNFINCKGRGSKAPHRICFAWLG